MTQIHDAAKAFKEVLVIAGVTAAVALASENQNLFELAGYATHTMPDDKRAAHDFALVVSGAGLAAMGGFMAQGVRCFRAAKGLTRTFSFRF